MAIHHPPRAGRARRSPGPVIGRSLGVGLAITVAIAAGCASSNDDASTLPDELTAAEDAAVARDSGDTGGEGTAAETVADDAFVAEGFDPIEDVDDDPEPPAVAATVDLTDDSPATVIDEVADQLDNVDDGEELLNALEPVDRAEPPTVRSDGRPRNGVGELLELDAEASLACAQVEIAIGQLDIGLPGVASERILSAADRAEASTIDDIRTWADPLRDVLDGGPLDDPAPLVGFLSVCTEGGYEL